MKTLKLVIASLFLAAFTQNVSAQDRPRLSPEQKQEKKDQLQKDQDRLQLTPEQQTKMKEINRKYADAFQKARENSKQEKRAAGKEMRERRNGEIKGILSESQYKTFQQIQDERKNRMKDRRKAE